MTQVQCKHCKHATTTDTPIEWVELSCPRCGQISCAYQSSIIKTEYTTIDRKKLSFHLGEKIKYQNEDYEIVSIAIKNIAKYKIKWAEYTLVSSKNKWLYLSECNGHWVKLEDTKKPKVFRYGSKNKIHEKLFKNHRYHDIYSKDYVEVLFAEGIFTFRNSSKKYELAEYICPPYILSIEFRDGDYQAVYGEHIDKSEILAMKPSAYLPAQIGIGAVEPYQWDVFKYLNIYLSAAAVIICLFFLTLALAQNRKLLRMHFMLSDNSEKEAKSESFELKGWASAPLSFRLYSNNDNSWTSATVELVNEQTNESIIATKDVEYYNGYEGGERWSEGSNSDEFSICGVGAGKYHILLTAQKDIADNMPRDMTVEVDWDKPSFWNAGLALLALAGIAGFNYYLTRNHDVNRWKDSDFNIYYVEEE